VSLARRGDVTVCRKELAVLLVIGCAQSAAASQATATLGAIAGIVLSPDRNPVPGARVVLLGGRQTAITNAAGEFELTSLPAGDYDLVAECELLSAERQRVAVAGGETSRITVSLEGRQPLPRITGETPTAGWTTIDIDGVYVVSRQRATHMITAAAFNLANRSYRVHTSYLKETSPLKWGAASA
jgi:Carboxypeptidase regulatory-like domain